VVDGKYKEKLDQDGNPTGEVVYEPLSQSDLDALNALVSRSIGIDEARGDQITVKNLHFTRDDDVKKDNAVEKVSEFSQTYLAPFAGIFKYLFVLILLLVAYKKAIVPFAEKMLEVSKEEEELEKPTLELDEDEEENLVEKVQAMRKKVESQLGVSEGFNEDELKYDVLLEKVKSMTEEQPEEVASLLQALLSEESITPVKRDKEN
jgi:flagellar M-ring protein FliF